ncbi:MAG: hypothetical protein Q7S45_02925 [Candidatus Curtissbacteria bacterium]|nr:hypothetical protein [Candidatus Curtissbacteria bacterium]
MRKFAKIISRVFDSYFWFPLLLLTAIAKTGLWQNQIIILLPLLALIDVICPIVGFKFLMKTGKVSDIDVTNRHERYLLFGLANVLFLIGTIISFLFSNQLFFTLHLTALLMGLTLLGITFFFKISGHVFMAFGSLFLINFLYDWRFLWFFLLTLPIAYARIYLKKHTLAQVLTGAIVGLAEPYLILKLFKLI